MIEDLLPRQAACVAVYTDPPGGLLFPEEEAVVARSVEKRRREFTTVRVCARAALARLGLPPAAVVPGPRGEPQWPPGVVGSMTHCDGYRAAAVARSHDLVAIGIDAEPNQPVSGGVLEAVSVAEERAWIARLRVVEPSTAWDRLLFCAKEAVYKAWFPLTGQPLEFEEARVTVDPTTRRFTARLLRRGAGPDDRWPTELAGRWLVGRGLVVTAIAIPPTARDSGPDPVA